MRHMLGLCLCLCLFSAYAAETTTPTLEERMSQGEFRAAGLNKLAPAELKALNDWLAAHATTKIVHDVVTPAGKPVFDTEQGQRQAIDAHIAGSFRGWFGKTVFTLDNGQQWQQAESGQMGNVKFEKPKVKIKPMLLGSWLMYVEPCGCSVRVERIK